MKIFIDSGSVHEIESLVPLGIIDGITTNPSLLAKESGDPRDHQADLPDRRRPGERGGRLAGHRGHDRRGPRAGRPSTSTSSSRFRSRAKASARCKTLSTTGSG